MDEHTNEISELKIWAKDDIVPGDLQELCRSAANSIVGLQTENEALKKTVEKLQNNRDLCSLDGPC